MNEPNFSDLLRGFRQRHDWTQATAADACGVALSTWQHWEQGIGPSGETMRNLAIRVMAVVDQQQSTAAKLEAVTQAKLVGYDAVEAKLANPGIILCKHADPIEGAKVNLTFEEAREIVREDPSLIHTLVTKEPQ